MLNEKKQQQKELKSKQGRNLALLKSQKKALKEKERQYIRQLRQREEALKKQNAKKKKKLKKEAAPHSAQNTLNYKYMFDDGVCQVSDNLFSKTLKFSDINYRVAQQEEQIEIFSSYCEILNYFDPDINVQISVHNRKIDKEAFKEQMLLPMKGNELDDYRKEYNQRHYKDKTQ